MVTEKCRAPCQEWQRAQFVQYYFLIKIKDFNQEGIA